MSKRNKIASGAAIGLLAGSAVGAIGVYMAQQYPREVKRAMKQASRTADRALSMMNDVMSFVK